MISPLISFKAIPRHLQFHPRGIVFLLGRGAQLICSPRAGLVGGRRPHLQPPRHVRAERWRTCPAGWGVASGRLDNVDFGSTTSGGCSLDETRREEREREVDVSFPSLIGHRRTDARSPGPSVGEAGEFLAGFVRSVVRSLGRPTRPSVPGSLGGLKSQPVACRRRRRAATRFVRGEAGSRVVARSRGPGSRRRRRPAENAQSGGS